MKSYLTCRQRAHRHIREIADEAGPMLSTASACDILDISHDELDSLRTSGSIIAVQAGDEWRYPEVQFRDGRPLPRLGEILAAHHGVDGWVVLDSLLAADSAYNGRSILDLLRQGDDESLDHVLLVLHEQYAP